MDERFSVDPGKAASEGSEIPVLNSGAGLVGPADDTKDTVARVVVTDAMRRLTWRRRQARPWMRGPHGQAPEA